MNTNTLNVVAWTRVHAELIGCYMTAPVHWRDARKLCRRLVYQGANPAHAKLLLANISWCAVAREMNERIAPKIQLIMPDGSNLMERE